MYIIFGRESCWYCKNSQTILTNKKQKYMFYNIDSDKYREYSRVIPEDFSTVPRIIKETLRNKKFIGGFDSLVLYLRNLKKTKKKNKRKSRTKKKYNRK